MSESTAAESPVLRLKGFTGSKTENMYKLIGIEDKKASYTKAFEFRSVGYGKQDVPSLLEAANECEIKWLVAEQDAPHGQKTSLECAEMYSI